MASISGVVDCVSVNPSARLSNVLRDAQKVCTLTIVGTVLKEARKGFFVVAVLVKRWKITKKDISWCGKTACLLATLLLGYTLRVLVTSYQLPWQRTRSTKTSTKFQFLLII